MPQVTQVEVFVDNEDSEGKSKGKLFPITVLCLFGCILIIMLGLIKVFKTASTADTGRTGVKNLHSVLSNLYSKTFESGFKKFLCTVTVYL